MHMSGRLNLKDDTPLLWKPQSFLFKGPEKSEGSIYLFICSLIHSLIHAALGIETVLNFMHLHLRKSQVKPSIRCRESHSNIFKIIGKSRFWDTHNFLDCIPNSGASAKGTRDPGANVIDQIPSES